MNNWIRLKETLADVLAVDRERRTAFLDGAGLSDDDRAEIELFLRADDEANGFLSVSATGLTADFFDGSPDPDPVDHQSRVIGPYRIVRELGTGGMGAVFLAERNDGKFEQRVAIKMLRREFDSDVVRKTFEREKEILAALSHPYIASLIDAGTTDDGVPFLVMEYVEGLPVDQFCTEQTLDLHERLKLFNKICEALAFAHHNLIVHRDVKPSNVLVTRSGVPKLLDFGISKILEAGSIESDRGATVLGAMTPDYASPEQIDGRQVTTATDVYSLGVLLYKLLTGSHPFKRPGETRSQLLTAITTREPTLPSSRIDSRRPADPAFETLNGKALRGDLDNIILKSIRKEPEQRYQSVEQLSADIWRYIDGQPVEARPATPTYRLAKFYKRNRVSVAAALLIVAALVGGLSVALWQTSEARASAVSALHEAERAQAEQKKSEKVSRFLMKIVSYANPRWHAEGAKFGGEARVIDALNDLASKIDTEFADQPDVLAELHHQFADTYMGRQEPELKVHAQAHAARALELRRSHYGDWHELVAKDMVFVYWLTDDRVTNEEAVKMFMDAIVMMRETNPRNLNLPFMLEELVQRLVNDRRPEQAALYMRYMPASAPADVNTAANQYYEEMMSLLRTHYAEDSPQVAVQKCRGAALKYQIGRIAESEGLFGECAKASQTNPGLNRWIAAYRSLTDGSTSTGPLP